MGKLTERDDRTKTKMISDPHELYRFLATPGIEVASLVVASDDVVWASRRFIQEEDISNLHHTNKVIVAYVAAGARLHLYNYLHRLQERAIYCNTDSVVFVQPRAESPLVETGDNLGDITSEHEPSEIIEEVVCGGPKNYAHKVVDTRTGKRKRVCKVRGITLNYNASRVVNFDVIRDMILGAVKERTVTVHSEQKIKRKRKREGEGIVSIVTEPGNKMSRISFFKRRRLRTRRSSPSATNETRSNPHPLDRRERLAGVHMTDVKDLKFKAPFTCIISGTSGFGKSSFCIRFLHHLDSLCTESRFAGGINWCYSERAAVPRLPSNVRYHEGVTEILTTTTLKVADRAS